MNRPPPHTHPQGAVRRWPSEGPLLALVVLVSIVGWLVLFITIVGAIYALLIAAFFALAHVIFIAHVRGNGVKTGPDQFPELHRAVQRLAGQMGLRKTPEAYVMQAGGALNALATRFLGANFIILYSDLLEACGEDTAARDMIIAHELGHIKAGHLQLRWLLLPGLLTPFLGTALSRAREFTCDRYGLAGAGDIDGALLGLAILAAGPQHGRQVNLAALARQRADMNTGWMTIGEWLSTHPPLAKRIAALNPRLQPGRTSSSGVLRAVLILALVIGSLGGLTALFVVALLPFLEETSELASDPAPAGELNVVPLSAEDSLAATRQVGSDLEDLARLIEAERAATGEIPSDIEQLYILWEAEHPDQEPPLDPFDGFYYGYQPLGSEYLLYSSGPDRLPATADDIVYDSSEP